MTKMLIILNRNLVETFDIYHRGQCLIYGGNTMPLLVRKQAGIASISVSKLSSATSWLSETDMFFQSAPLACSTSCFCVASVADTRACLRQRHLYDRHLAQQFADRKAYWTMRASSRLKEKMIVCILDGMD